MKKWIGLFLALILLCVCVVSAAAAYIKITEKRQADAVAEMAQQLGFDPQDHLVQTRRCWDIITHCGVYLYFDTGMSLDELQARTQQLGLDQKHYDRIDGYSLFSDINLGTGHELTVDGNDGVGNRGDLPQPEAHEWQLDDAQGRRWVIGFYDLTRSGAEYALDGKQIQPRIVSVMLRTK